MVAPLEEVSDASIEKILGSWADSPSTGELLTQEELDRSKKQVFQELDRQKQDMELLRRKISSNSIKQEDLGSTYKLFFSKEEKTKTPETEQDLSKNSSSTQLDLDAVDARLAIVGQDNQITGCIADGGRHPVQGIATPEQDQGARGDG